MTDHHLLRAKDLTMILGMIGIIIYLFNISSHVVHWDDTAKKVEDLDSRTTLNTTAVAVLNAQYFEINKKLETIDRHTR